MKGNKKKRNRTAGVWGAIRFLGAFRRGSLSLEDSLAYELGKGAHEERAAMALRGNYPDLRVMRGVGLLFPKTSVTRVFSGDCWSESNSSGALYPTRNIRGISPACHGYEECFLAKGAFPLAIVVAPSKVRNNDNYAKIESLSRMYRIPVILLDLSKCLSRCKEGGYSL